MVTLLICWIYDVLLTLINCSDPLSGQNLLVTGGQSKSLVSCGGGRGKTVVKLKHYVFVLEEWNTVVCISSFIHTSLEKSPFQPKTDYVSTNHIYDYDVKHLNTKQNRGHSRHRRTQDYGINMRKATRKRWINWRPTWPDDESTMTSDLANESTTTIDTTD